MSESASSSAGDDSIGRAMTPDAPGLLEAPEIVRRELPADAEHVGDLRGLRVLHPSEREQHTEADVAILPVPRIEPVHLGFSAGHVVPAPPLHENLNPVIHSTRRISILW